MSSIARLFALEAFGIKLGLEAMRALLAELGQPQARWPALHVAGTNGKGSVTAIADAALRAAGRRVGRYTSPHLSALEERIAVDGQPIATAELSLCLDRVFAAVDRLVAAGTVAAVPTFFEVSTAAAFLAFARAKVDVAVIEVGLGGRFDATNVLTPVTGAITTIAFDHERHLGTTLAAIAREKAGIAKSEVPLVVGEVGADAWSAIVSTAAEAGAPIVRASDGVALDVNMRRGHAEVALTTPAHAYPHVRLGLAGRHQVDNALVAVRLLEVAAERRPDVAAPPEAIVAGLRDVRWPARIEWLRGPRGEQVLVDAAHNPSGAQALADYLRASETAGVTLVTSIMADKDVAGILGPLLPFAGRVVATHADSARAVPSRQLADLIAELAPRGTAVSEQADPWTALTQAYAALAPVLLAGSIYLVGPLRARLLAAGFVSA